MATHSSTLAWRIPWTEEPGRLQSMGSLKNQSGEENQVLMVIANLCRWDIISAALETL